MSFFCFQEIKNEVCPKINGKKNYLYKLYKFSQNQLNFMNDELLLYKINENKN